MVLLHREGENQENHIAGIEVIVAKHRNGPTGERGLVFLRKFQQFKNAERKRPGDKEAQGQGHRDDNHSH